MTGKATGKVKILFSLREQQVLLFLNRHLVLFCCSLLCVLVTEIRSYEEQLRINFSRVTSYLCRNCISIRGKGTCRVTSIPEEETQPSMTDVKKTSVVISSLGKTNDDPSNKQQRRESVNGECKQTT